MYQAVTQSCISFTQLSTCVGDCALTAPSRWFNVSMSTSALVRTCERHSSVSWRETSHSSASLLVECLHLNTSHHSVSYFWIFILFWCLNKRFMEVALILRWIICAFKVTSSLHCHLVMACCQENTARIN